MTTTEHDPAIYSNVGHWVADDTEDGGGHFQPRTWRELCADREAQLARLRGFETIVNDLDRNTNGRHEGDADVFDPTGVSQGNPRLKTGDVLGYSIAGDRRPYLMPERGRRHDPEAWGAR